MFLFTGALFVLCGLLLLAKARKMGICAVVLMFLGLRLTFYAFTTV